MPGEGCACLGRRIHAQCSKMNRPAVFRAPVPSYNVVNGTPGLVTKQSLP